MFRSKLSQNKQTLSAATSENKFLHWCFVYTFLFLVQLIWIFFFFLLFVNLTTIEVMPVLISGHLLYFFVVLEMHYFFFFCYGVVFKSTSYVLFGNNHHSIIINTIIILNIKDKVLMRLYIYLYIYRHINTDTEIFSPLNVVHTYWNIHPTPYSSLCVS